MVKKKRFHWSVKLGTLIGSVAIVLFYYLYGWEMLLRYLLGAVIFASITLPFIVQSIKRNGNKKIGI